MRIPILMYHGIDSAEHGYRHREPGEREWLIHRDVFRRQMAILARLGYQPVLLRELAGLQPWQGFPRHPIVLTFDDGHETHFLNALPVLEEFHFKAEFFITSGWIDTENYMSSQQLRELVRRGMSVQAHGQTHRFLSNLDDGELRFELVESRKQIASAAGIGVAEVCYLAYPGGRHDIRTERYLRETGYRGSCTSRRGPHMLQHSMFAMKRLGLTKDTTDRQFRALVKGDGTFFARQRLRRAMIGFVRRVAGKGLFDSIRALRTPAGRPRESGRVR